MHQFVVDRRETLVEVTGLGTLCDKSVDNEPHRMKTPAAATAFEGPSELRDERGRFVIKSRVGKRRSGTRGMRDGGQGRN